MDCRRQQNQLGEAFGILNKRLKQGARTLSEREDQRIPKDTLEKVLNAPPVIQYEMRPFHSNKSFNNLFGKESRLVRDRIDFFMNILNGMKTKAYLINWVYCCQENLGVERLLYYVRLQTGPKDIINLKLSNLATATQLKNIFYNDYISVCTDDDSVKKLLIPADKRIYVFEEIDTIGELVQERSLRFDANKSVLQDELTLGDILQFLDGTIEIPGRIMVMTSNFPERLDRALLRPGRIDIKVDFGFAHPETIAEVINGMLDVDVDSKDLPNEKLTVAECSILCLLLFITLVMSKRISLRVCTTGYKRCRMRTKSWKR